MTLGCFFPYQWCNFFFVFFLLFLWGSSNQFQFFQRTVPLRRIESRQLFHKVAILWYHMKNPIIAYKTMQCILWTRSIATFTIEIWEGMNPDNCFTKRQFYGNILKGLCHVILGCLWEMSVTWNSFTDNTIVTSQTRWFWGKRPLSRLLAINLKKVGPIFFTIIQMQSYSISSICVHRCFSLSFCWISFMLFDSFKWLLQCFILLFWCNEITSFWHSPFKKPIISLKNIHLQNWKFCLGGSESVPENFNFAESFIFAC